MIIVLRFSASAELRSISFENRLCLPSPGWSCLVLIEKRQIVHSNPSRLESLYLNNQELFPSMPLSSGPGFDRAIAAGALRFVS
jgi:hypothetical protein